MTDAGLESLANLAALETIYVNTVSGTFTDAALAHLRNLNKLRKLHLAPHTFSGAALDAFQTALPLAEMSP